MLLHELAHIKRGDLVMHSLYMLLQIVYWYNPLLWLVRRHMHHLRELSCDGTVAELLRERTPAYRQTLLETARRMLTTSVEPGLGLLGLFEDSNHLLVRLNWLTKPTWRYSTMKRAIVATIALLMFACVLPMAQARSRHLCQINAAVPVHGRRHQQTRDQIPRTSPPCRRARTTEGPTAGRKEPRLTGQAINRVTAGHDGLPEGGATARERASVRWGPRCCVGADGRTRGRGSGQTESRRQRRGGLRIAGAVPA
jgi:hypothetical protein